MTAGVVDISFPFLHPLLSVIFVDVVDLQLHLHPVPLTTKVMNSNPAHGEVYSIPHYVIKFVSDLGQVGDFPRVLRYPPQIKTVCHDVTEIFLKVGNITYVVSSKPRHERNSNLQL